MLPFEELPKDYPTELVRSRIETEPYPIFVMAYSGLHLYGMEYPGSEYLVRGIHVPTLRHLYGKENPGDSIDSYFDDGNLRIDFSTEDVTTFSKLILEGRCYAIEDLYSPLVVQTSPEHQQLMAVVQNGLSLQVAREYLCRAETLWDVLCSRASSRLENLLYVFRSLLVGINLLRNGTIQCNLKTLGEEAQLAVVDDLFEFWLAYSEGHEIRAAEVVPYEPEYRRLVAEFNSDLSASKLPQLPSGHQELKDLVERIHRVY